MKDAVYVVEYRSISQGIGVLDNMIKRANMSLLYANPICIGKYLICLGGDVSAIEEAQSAAEEDSGGSPMASYLLTGAHPAILGYFYNDLPKPEVLPEALGIFETRNASAGFASLDKALKSANVCVLRVWLGQQIGGKLCYVLGGSVSDIQAAIRAAQETIEDKEYVGSRVIPSPDATTMKLFLTLHQ